MKVEASIVAPALPWVALGDALSRDAELRGGANLSASAAVFESRARVDACLIALGLSLGAQRNALSFDTPRALRARSLTDSRLILGAA